MYLFSLFLAFKWGSYKGTFRPEYTLYKGTWSLRVWLADRSPLSEFYASYGLGFGRLGFRV